MSAFKIRNAEFMHGEKFVTIVPGYYGICVCLKTRQDNTVELIKFEKLEINAISKTLADYLSTDDLSLSEIIIGGRIFSVPQSRNRDEIKEKLKKLLESLSEESNWKRNVKKARKLIVY